MLAEQLHGSGHRPASIGVHIIDLDRFKDINDTFGHHVGDRALREVAGVLRAGIRPYDICVRYAGDEFIVVLSGCSGEEAERKRLELQRAVDGLEFEARPGKMLALAISIGAAVSRPDRIDTDDLVARADAALYAAKAGGRDTVFLDG